MIKMNRLILYINIGIFVLIVFVGCKDKRINEYFGKALFSVTITPQKDTLVLSSFFSNYRIVEFPDIMTDIIDVTMVDSLLVIRGQFEGKDIHVCGLDGKFLRSLVTYGRSNKEVLNMQSFRYNKYNNTIDVLCNYGAQIFQYTLDGQLINSITIPENSIAYAKDFIPINSTEYIVYKDLGYLQDVEYKIYIYDSENNVVKNQFMVLDKVEAEIVSIGQKNFLFEKEGDVLFYDVTLDGVYRVNADSLKMYISFEENKYSLSKDIVAKSSDLTTYINNCINSNGIWAHINMIEYADMLYSTYSLQKNDRYLNVIDVKNKKSNSYYYLMDDLISKTVFPIQNLNIINSIDNHLVISFFDDRVVGSGVPYVVMLNK